MKINLTVAISFAIIVVSSVAYAGNYTSEGNNIYYDGNKIGEIQRGWNGWKGLCRYKRNRGKIRLYSQKQDAIQSVVNECRTY